jgi:opacity protein-like surface antigen
MRMRSDMRIKMIVSLAVLLLATGRASAQKNELGVLVGGLKSGNHDIASGGGFLDLSIAAAYEVSYDRRFVNLRLAALYFEVPLVITPTTDIKSSNALSPKSYSSIFLTPGLKLKVLPGSPISPYGLLGAGFGRYKSSDTLAGGQANPDPRSSTHGAFDFGGGIDVKLIPFVGLRAEVRDLVSGSPNFNVAVLNTRQHNVLLAGGIVLRF